ncbi:MAG: hypothetical protein AB8H86_18055 [Polyangiales bacterium]
MEMSVFVDPVKLVGGNFGVDGSRSAAKLGALVKAELEREFPGAMVRVSEGPEAVHVTPENHELATRALNLLSAMRKTSDYLVFFWGRRRNARGFSSEPSARRVLERFVCTSLFL